MCVNLTAILSRRTPVCNNVDNAHGSKSSTGGQILPVLHSTDLRTKFVLVFRAIGAGGNNDPQRLDELVKLQSLLAS